MYLSSQHIRFEFNCNEPEHSFSNTDCGEYCSACNKVVIDLTAKAIPEIMEIIKANGGAVCGKIYPEQLSISEAKRRSSLRLALAGIAALLSLSSAEGQTTRTSVKTEQIDFLRTGTDDEVQIIPGSFCDLKSIDNDSLPPDEEVKVVKRKTFLRIGRRRFFVMNKFPFFGTSKQQYFRGKFMI